MLKYIVLGLIGAVVALAVYVRLVPLNPLAWHTTDLPMGTAGEFTGAGSHTVLRDVPDAAAALVALDAIIKATPRTKRVAGGVDEGRITYVTRSRVMGFPDYTTVSARAPDTTAGRDMGSLAIYGRLRFGKADVGVNRARINGWMAQLDKDLPNQ